MSDPFVRGGQLSLHSLRMLKQVMYVLFKGVIILLFGITAGFCVYKLGAYDLKVLYWYTLASLYIDFGQQESLLLIEGINGNPIIMSAIKLVNNTGINAIILHNTQTLWQGFVWAASICCTLFLIITAIFLHRGATFSKDGEIRGNTLMQPQSLKKLINSKNKKDSYQGYLIGGVPYPTHSETTHTLIAGSTGAGKTILISELIAQIKKRGDRAIIFDKMGIYTERFYDPTVDVLLNPFDKRSPNWSIFKEIGHEAGFDGVATALMPLDKGNADPFWIKAARTLFSEVCCSLLKKGGVSNKELVNTLLKKDLKEAAKLVKGTAAQAIIDEQSPKTALSVMAVLSTYLKCLKFLKDEGELFSIRDWVKDDKGKGCIFISSTGDLHPTLTPLISAWLEIAINNILSLPRSRERKIWVILDELPSLHTLPSLEQGLAETRQFGGCFVLSLQSISQLRDRYGSNGSQTLSSLCNNKIFLRAGDYDSARWYSDNIGASEIEEIREGLSYGAHEMRDGININRHKQTKHLVLPSELTNLKDKEGYFCMAKGYPVAKVSFEYVDWPKMNAKLEEAVAGTQIEESTEDAELATLLYGT